jgi:hypothetical protein
MPILGLDDHVGGTSSVHGIARAAQLSAGHGLHGFAPFPVLVVARMTGVRTEV